MAQELGGLPLVSVLIPCYERAEMLERALAELQRQDYAMLEILVLDDCSPTADIKSVAARFPNVVFRRTPSNRGLIAARNYGATLCSGKYLLNLDDDSWPVASDAISHAVNLMEADPNIGVLAFSIDQRDGPTNLPVGPDEVKPTPNYIGCGNLYRMSVIQEVGPYMEAFNRQGEEIERCLRIRDANYTIMQACGLIVWHDMSSLHRSEFKTNSYNLINRIRTELLRAPIQMLPASLLRALGYAVNNRWRIDFRLVRQELCSKEVGALAMIRQRRPVRLSTYRAVTRMIRRSPKPMMPAVRVVKLSTTNS